MSYVLIATIIHASIGAVDTQQIGSGYQTYQQCAEDAVARVESLRAIHPDSEVKWECQRQ